VRRDLGPVQFAGLVSKVGGSAGELAARVPSILSLAQEHGVSHRSAAHALTTLRDEGLIISVRGKGYYVAGGASGR